MNIYEHEKVIVFVDGPHMHAAAKALGFDVDYKRMLNLFRRQSRLIRAYYYTTLLEQQDYTSLRPLVDWLQYNGYTMVTKPAKEFIDNTGRRRVKGSMDVELTVHAMQLVDQYDHAVICSGDGDFRSLVAALQVKGKRVSVISTLESETPMVSDELRRQADQFVDLADLEPLIARELGDRRSVRKGPDDGLDQPQRPVAREREPALDASPPLEAQDAEFNPGPAEEPQAELRKPAAKPGRPRSSKSPSEPK